MSDDLDRAVDAQIAAYSPSTVPPFAVIESRRRRRDRSRLTAATAGVALVVVVVATAALAGPGLGGKASEQLAPIAAPSTDTPRSPEASAWDGRTGPLVEDGVAASCVETYSPTTLVNRSFAFDGTVTAIGASVTNRADKGPLQLAGVTFAVNEWYRGGDQVSVTVDLPMPGPDPAYEVGSRLLVSGEPRWGGESLDQPIAWGMCGGFTRYYDPETARVWHDAFAAQDSPDNLRLTNDVRGAQLCQADNTGGYPDSGCRLVGHDGALRLVRALNGAQPQGRQPLCDAAGPTYRLTFDIPGAKAVPIVIPVACGPIEVGAARYRINDRVARAVAVEYGLEAKLAEFIQRCVGNEANVGAAGDYLGDSERDLDRARDKDGVDVRVVGRDGTCLTRDDDSAATG